MWGVHRTVMAGHFSGTDADLQDPLLQYVHQERQDESSDSFQYVSICCIYCV